MADDQIESSESGTAGPPWPVTLGLAFGLGLMCGGVLVYALGWSRSDQPPKADREQAEARIEVEPALLEAAADPGERAPLDHEVVLPRREPSEEVETELTAVDELPVHDGTPSSLHRAFGAAILELVAMDDDGQARPRTAAVLVEPDRILAPYTAVEGTAQAAVDPGDGRTVPVRGVIAFQPQFDLVLLELEQEITADPPRVLPGSIGATVDAVLLGCATDEGWRATAVRVGPGPPDRLTRSPRLALEKTATCFGALLNSDGMLLGLVAEPSTTVLAVHPAAGWIGSDVSPISLPAFARNAGLNSPTSKLRMARKLLSQRRYEEASRMLLDLAAGDARLVEELADDIRLAVLEAANSRIAAGNGPAAVALLAQALISLPRDAEMWAARGRAEAVSGDVRLAIASLLQAGELLPEKAVTWREEARGMLLDQANLFHQQGHTDTALAMLLEERSSFPADGRVRLFAAELLLAARRFRQAADLFREAAALDASLAAEARRSAERALDLSGGPGAIVIDFPPGAQDVVITASIEGGPRTALLVRPTEELTVLSSQVARAAGHDLASARRTRFFPDPWAAEVPSIRLGSLSINGISSQRIQAVVVDGYAAPAADGVLGASFLSRYRLVEDRHLGRMVLHPR